MRKFTDEGVYVDTDGRLTKNVILQWGELPSSIAYIGTGQIMGWGQKAIEIRSAETGHLDGVFMHKKNQRLKFLCERNDKVRTDGLSDDGVFGCIVVDFVVFVVVVVVVNLSTMCE